jgi:hypothetical protein
MFDIKTFRDAGTLFAFAVILLMTVLFLFATVPAHAEGACFEQLPAPGDHPVVGPLEDRQELLRDQRLVA